MKSFGSGGNMVLKLGDLVCVTQFSSPETPPELGTGFGRVSGDTVCPRIHSLWELDSLRDENLSPLISRH